MSDIINVRIERVVFEQMPLFTAVPIRGYSMTGDANAITALHNMPGAAMGGLSPTTVAANAGALITLDEASAPLHIINGWEETRCNAVIEAYVEESNGVCKLFRFRGYTDRIDFTHTGIPAPDLMIFFNNVEEIRLADRIPVGLQSAQQVYYNPYGAQTSHGDTMYTIRPPDVLTSVAAVEEMNRVSSPDFDDAAYTCGISTGGEIPVTMNVSSQPAANWLATILNAYINAHMDKERGITTGSALSMAIDATTSMPIYTNAFIRALSQAIQSMNPGFAHMSFGEICALDPALATDDRRCIFTTNLNLSTETSSFVSNRIEAAIAQQVATHVRPWMYDARIASVSFTVTNMTMDGTIVLNYNDAIASMVPLSQEAKSQYVNTFSTNIKFLLMPVITKNGLVELSITVAASHSSMITVVITLQGRNPERYTYPAFMDNAFSPVITRRSSIDTGDAASQILASIDMQRSARQSIGTYLGNPDRPLALPTQYPSGQYQPAQYAYPPAQYYTQPNSNVSQPTPPQSAAPEAPSKSDAWLRACGII